MNKFYQDYTFDNLENIINKFHSNLWNQADNKYKNYSSYSKHSLEYYIVYSLDQLKNILMHKFSNN